MKAAFKHLLPFCNVNKLHYNSNFFCDMFFCVCVCLLLPHPLCRARSIITSNRKAWLFSLTRECVWAYVCEVFKCVGQAWVWKKCCCAGISVLMLLSYSPPYQPLNTFLHTNRCLVHAPRFAIISTVCLVVPKYVRLVCVCVKETGK